MADRAILESSALFGAKKEAVLIFNWSSLTLSLCQVNDISRDHFTHLYIARYFLDISLVIPYSPSYLAVTNSFCNCKKWWTRELLIWLPFNSIHSTFCDCETTNLKCLAKCKGWLAVLSALDRISPHKKAAWQWQMLLVTPGTFCFRIDW